MRQMKVQEQEQQHQRCPVLEKLQTNEEMTVTTLEVMINGPSAIWPQRRGALLLLASVAIKMPTNGHFSS